MRIGFLSVASQLSSLQQIALKLCLQTGLINPVPWIRILVLLLLFLCFGNPFRNFAFLLSALGASFMEACGLILSAVHRHWDAKGRRFYPRLSKCERMTHHMVLTTLTVSIALTPLFPTDLAHSIPANLLAFPIVTFLVTPLSLCALFLPENWEFLCTLATQSLDYSLTVLAELAACFRGNEDGLSKNPLAFANTGRTYLTLLLLTTWTVLDAAAVKSWGKPTS